MSTVQMNAASIGGLIQLPFTGNVTVPANGIITVDSRDAIDLLRDGATYVKARTIRQSLGAPIAGVVGQLVASAAFANGTLSIANQPDIPRLASLRIDPGTSAITAGNVAVNYLANDGTTVTDNFSAIGPGTAVQSTNLSRGIVHLNSAIITAVAGGATPKIQMDTLNSLGVVVDVGFFNFAVLDVVADDAPDVVLSTQSSAACFTPSTVPNATHTYSAVVTFDS